MNLQHEKRLIRSRMAIKPAAIVVLLLLAIFSWAGTATITLSTNPTMSVADGRSTMTVSADVRDGNGRSVPDGTQVVFTTTIGTFRENVVTTSGGLARAILVSPSITGSATITASVLALNAVGRSTVEFVSDRSLLSSARDYIEIVSDSSLKYSPENQVVQASGSDHGAKLMYRDIEIEADQLQLRPAQYEVRAWNARIKIGKNTYSFDQLQFVLTRRRGLAVIQKEVEKTVVKPAGKALFAVSKEQGFQAMGYDLSSSGANEFPMATVPQNYNLLDLTNAVTIVSGKKAVVFPARQIDFHRAEVFVGGAKVMKVPLFQLNPNERKPIITDQFVNVTNNQLAINYPYYLTLKPGQTSLLRFRNGTRYGSGTGASTGTFLDYELSWNRGSDSEGGLIFNGLARRDWGLSARHYLRLGERTTMSAQLDFPANTTLYGTLSLSHQMAGYSANYNSNFGRAVRGSPFSSVQHYFGIEKDPVKLGNSPLRYTYGFTSSLQTYSGGGTSSRTQESYGLKARIQSDLLRLSPRTSISSSITASGLTGRNVHRGLTTSLTTSLSQSFGSNANVVLTYDFLDDGFNSLYIGRHRLSAQSYIGAGNLTMSVFATKALDLDRMNTFVDLGYRLSTQWRLGTSYTYDRYGGASFLDYSLVIGYRLGYRDVGLSWSKRTHRLGIEILGASLN